MATDLRKNVELSTTRAIDDIIRSPSDKFDRLDNQKSSIVKRKYRAVATAARADYQPIDYRVCRAGVSFSRFKMEPSTQLLAATTFSLS